ncbi:MAG TPA: DUF1592 domain-containing protein [Polyangiaceae bacterium]|nr:DUF1592 domain-containing protein [Polyangiaceae bacterium]
MHEITRWSGLPTTLLALGVTALAGGCTGVVDGNKAGMQPTPPGVSGGGTGGSSAVTPTVDPATCDGTEVPVPKRLVRLSFNQIANSVRALTDDAEAAKIASTYEIGDSEHRTFPPLASPREGSTLTDKTWATGDKIASDIGKYAFDNVATVSGCGATPTEDCARTYVAAFAERAYRRPLTADEKTSLLQVVTEVLGFGGTAAQAIQFGVYAALESPGFLYRTEFGTDAKAAGPLTPSETANQLSFFLTDGPPDKPLLDAAAAGALASSAQVTEQVARILQTPAAKQNLQDALFSYFGLFGLDTVVVDSTDFNSGVRNSMYHEAELFLANNMWSGPLSNLITARKSMISQALAPIYGISVFPPAGVTPDADGFALVDLPDNRAGILTQSGFLTARSRPDQPSVVGRGLLVNSALLCAANPPFPANLADQIAAVNTMLAEETERKKSDYRTSTPPCNGCHASFDPYGLALGNFDSIGRFTTVDAKGRPIDASVTLPPNAGSAQVKSAAELAQTLASGEAFSTCMAKNLMLYALAEIPTTDTTTESVTVSGCATKAIAHMFNSTGKTFNDLIAQVAVSNTLVQRSAGQGAP